MSKGRAKLSRSRRRKAAAQRAEPDYLIVTPRRVLIGMAFHEAGHAVVSLLLGEQWQSATLVRHKRKRIQTGYMGISFTAEPQELALIAAGGQIGEEIWRNRRGDEANIVPNAGASARDMAMMDEYGHPCHFLDQARELLTGHEDLVAWIARCLVRSGKVDVELVRRRLPRKLYSRDVLIALGMTVSQG